MTSTVRNDTAGAQVYYADSLQEAYDIANSRERNQDYKIVISQAPGSDSDLQYAVTLYGANMSTSVDATSSVEISLDNSITEDAVNVFNVMRLLAELSNDMREMAVNQKWFEFDQYKEKMQDYIDKIQDAALKNLITAVVTAVVEIVVAAVNAFSAAKSAAKGAKSLDLKQANQNQQVENYQKTAAQNKGKAATTGPEGEQPDIETQQQANQAQQLKMNQRSIDAERLSQEASKGFTNAQILNTVSQSLTRMGSAVGTYLAEQDRIDQEEYKVAAEKEKMFVEEWSTMAQNAQQLLTKLLNTLEQMLASIHEAKNIRF